MSTNPSESPTAESASAGDSVVRVLLDGHGGDDAPATVLAALQKVLGEPQAGELKLGIVGREDVLRPELERLGLTDAVALIPAEDVIEMSDAPAVAVRRKKQSSIHVGARLIRDGEWDCLVSAGNTGALMAIGKLILKTLPDIDRPAIASMLPARNDTRTLFLDVGANLDCNSDHLVQFAVMGHCYMQAAEGIASPRIGLLNIGTEDIKGTDVLKMAARKLAQSSLNFIGNVEGTDLFSDQVDVVVTDGFAGNIALKTMEGTARFLADTMREELTRGFSSKAGALFARSAIQRFRRRVDPGRYNGAPLLGLNGIVVKSHGSADPEAYANAIGVAVREVRSGLLSRIVASMQEWGEH